MYLEIITPERKVYEGGVDLVTLPGSKGSFQVLNNHAPIISSLDAGEVVYKDKKGAEHSVTVDGGVVEVLFNKITVLAESSNQ